VTHRAIERMKKLMETRDKPTTGIRIYVKSGGCSGLSYRVEFVDQIDPKDEMIEIDEVKVFIDSTALMFVIGSEMDYVEDMFKSGFSFTNPNEKGRCGCGESFKV